MAKKSDLLKEAIADAKAVRELALENAKEALKEAFTPKLQSMLSAKIQQEMEDMDDKEEMEDMEDMEMDEGAGYDAEKSNDPKDLNQFSDTKKPQATPDFKEEKELDEAADLKSSGIGDSDNKEPSKATHGDDSTTEDIEGIHPGSKPAKEDDYSVLDDSKYGLEEEVELDEELDLESIIKELEEDYMDDDYMDDDDDMEGMDDMDDMGDMKGDMEGGEGEVDYGKEEPAVDYGVQGGGREDDDEEIDIDLEPEEDEDMYGESKIAERREGDYEDGHEEKLADIDEAIASIKNAETIKELEAKVTKLEGQLEKKDTIVKEYYDGVKYLKEKLNEVNILNAKLLFTNKLFRNFNLDQKGKLRVIENFDRAQNIREIKLVFTTLAENLKSTQTVSQAKKRQVKRITEGASKVTKSTKPDKELMKEDGDVLPDFVVRAQKLAGITK